MTRWTRSLSRGAARWGYELRLLGIGPYVLPPAIVAIYLGFSLVLRYTLLQGGGDPAVADIQVGRGLLALLENGLSLGGGLTAAAAVASDAALELHLSTQAPYRATILRRLGVVLIWSLVVGGLTCGAVIAAGFWVFPVTGFDRQLVWLPAVLGFISLGALLSVLLRSRIASSAILAVLWIAQFLLKPMFLENGVFQRLYLFLSEQIFPDILQVSRATWYDVWLQNRLILLGMAAIFLIATVWALGRTEALLGAEG